MNIILQIFFHKASLLGEMAKLNNSVGVQKNILVCLKQSVSFNLTIYLRRKLNVRM